MNVIKKAKQKHQEINLLEGGIVGALTKLSLPIMASAFVQMTYSLIDMFWIGKLGYQPVAAVGVAGFFIWFGDGILHLARIGGQVYTGQALGRKDIKEAQSWAVSCLHLATLLALVYTAFLYIFAPQLVAFFQFSEAGTIEQAVSYLRIVCFGIFFTYTTRCCTGLTTIKGLSKISMQTSIIGLVLNIVLDPLFIFVFHWGVIGAALATILSQAIVLLLFRIVLRNIDLFSGWPIFRLQAFKNYWQVLRLGFPTAVQTMLYSSFSMILGRMTAVFGDAAISIQKVGSQIESVSWMTSEAFGVALTAFIAQNFGAEQWNRTKEGYRKAFLLMSTIGLITTALLYFGAKPLFAAFISEPEVLTGGISYLQILGVSQLFMCWEIMTASAFSGVGKTLTPAIVIITLTFARLPMAYFLMRTSLGLDGIWWSVTISSIAKGIVLTILYIIYLKRSERQRAALR